MIDRSFTVNWGRKGAQVGVPGGDRHENSIFKRGVTFSD
jgi:hypothetical protein